jgi:glutamate--cysteine ligase catalytic subunit
MTHSYSFAAGLLKVGVPKSWDDSKKDLRYIRRAGVRQFISTYNRVKDLKGNELLWGDEIEYGIFKLDHEGKKVRICLRGKEVRRGRPFVSVSDSLTHAISMNRLWMS